MLSIWKALEIWYNQKRKKLFSNDLKKTAYKIGIVLFVEHDQIYNNIWDQVAREKEKEIGD